MRLTSSAAQSFSEQHGNEFTALVTLLAGALIVCCSWYRFLRPARRRSSPARHRPRRPRRADRHAPALRCAAAIEAVDRRSSRSRSRCRSSTRWTASAATVLASGAITAAVVGFAARQTLANAMAGILLAVTQPIRIGDLVTFEGETGTVEDVGLTYTWLRTGADARLLVPNERLAGGILRNDSIRSADGRDRGLGLAGARRRRGRARWTADARAGRRRARAHRRDHRTTACGSWSWASPGRRRERLAREADAARDGALRALRARRRALLADRRGTRRGAATNPASLVVRRAERLLRAAPRHTCPAANDSAAGAATRAARPAPSSSPSASYDRRRARRARRRRLGRLGRQLRARRWTRIKPPDQGAASVDLRRRRQARLGFIQRRRPAHAGHRPPDPAGSCATRRSRSRTGASSSTRASTSRASSAPRSRTWSPSKDVQGGSTLTMQLIRNLYTEDARAQRRRGLQAQDPRGQARRGAREQAPGRRGKRWILDQVPQQRALRHRRRPDGGRHPGGGAHLLRQARRRS